jgi:hypothetical protein
LIAGTKIVIRIERATSGAAGKLQRDHRQDQGGQRGAGGAATRGATARHAKMTAKCYAAIVTRRG